MKTQRPSPMVGCLLAITLLLSVLAVNAETGEPTATSAETVSGATVGNVFSSPLPVPTPIVTGPFLSPLPTPIADPQDVCRTSAAERALGVPCSSSPTVGRKLDPPGLTKPKKPKKPKESPAALTSASNATDVATPNYLDADTLIYGSGRVVYQAIVLESNGMIDPSTENWDQERINFTMSKLASMTQWWTTLNPAANLTFASAGYVMAATRYEPISRPADRDERLWINDAMDYLGIPPLNNPYDYFTRVAQYNSILKQQYMADWGIVIFVVDDNNDPDHLFANFWSAYAYSYGPFFVMPYHVDGWGPARQDAIAAHEMGHVLGAMDQYLYEGWDFQKCTDKSGYLYTENQNLAKNCLLNEQSLMRGSVDIGYDQKLLDWYARGQIGWRDNDNDNIQNPVDTIPQLSVSDVPSNPAGRTPSFTGNAVDIPLPTLNPELSPYTINKIRVQASVNNGGWSDATPVDGAFDSASESWRMAFLLPNGTYAVRLRAINSVGNTSSISTHTVNVSSTAPIYRVRLPAVMR